MSKQRIAFHGTGLMGRPMAANLLKAGLPVTAWNRTIAKAEALRPAGAAIAASAAVAAEGADVVITMLEGGPVVEAVLFEDGVTAVLERGALVIDMSSAEPQRARAHAERLAKLGVGYLDAPVSGGTPAPRPAPSRSWRAAARRISSAPRRFSPPWAAPRGWDLRAPANWPSSATRSSCP
jgi:2-hydroxy-3-oxopropionate reductase